MRTKNWILLLLGGAMAFHFRNDIVQGLMNISDRNKLIMTIVAESIIFLAEVLGVAIAMYIFWAMFIHNPYDILNPH